jgi:hypothetical protein
MQSEAIAVLAGEEMKRWMLVSDTNLAKAGIKVTYIDIP